LIGGAIGALGQGCFVLRTLLQWQAAERAGRSVAPRSFWWWSLAGALLMLVFSVDRGEAVLAGGYAAGAWIYGRNLSLRADPAPSALSDRWVEIAFVSSLLVLPAIAQGLGNDAPSPAWYAVLCLGQLCWSSRFAVQWLHSERIGESAFPRVFWWLSLAGNGLLLAYAIHRREPILIAAFAFGPIAQVRNLALAGRRAAPIAR
jgi:4-amino-4-deoxy-L-arabinose transferase